jgi:TP901 family phage tail tape measure protein
VPDVADLRVVVSADTKPAESALSAFGSGLGGAIGVGVAAAGAAVAAGVAVGVKAAGDLQQSVANISTIKPEIDTSAVFASLNEMSTRIPQSAAQLGESLYNVFSSVDVSQEQALRLTEQFGKGATAAQTDAQTFGTSVMGVMNAYGLSVEDASHISDVFFNTVKVGVVTGQELASSLGPVTQAAKSAGVGIDQLGAMIAAVTKEGGPAAQNINNLNNFLQKVSTGPARTELEKLGIATTTADGHLREIPDVLADLKTRLAGMSQAEGIDALQHIFPDAQARQGAQTLLSQLDLVKSATLDNAGAVGIADAAYKTMSETFNSQVKLAMQGVMSILTTLGAEVLPALTPLITAFSRWLPGAFKAAQDALAPFGPMLQDAAKIISDAWTTVRQVFSRDWSPDATINPVVDAIGKIALVIRDDVMPAVSKIARFIAEEFGKVVDWFDANFPLIQRIVEQVLVGMEVFWREHGQNVLAIVQDAWTVIRTTIEAAFDIIGSVVHAFLQLLLGDWSGAWDTIVGLGERQSARLVTILGAAFDALLNVIDIATGGMVTTIETWVSDTATAVSDGWATIVQSVVSAWETLNADIVQPIADTITAVSDAWTTIQKATENILSAIGTVILDAFTAWYAEAIQPKLTAITTAVETAWDAVQSKTTEIFNAVLGYVRDTIFEPIRAAIQTKIEAARDLFGTAVDDIKSKAEGIFGPLLTWWRDTIWEPIRAAVDAAVYGPKGAHTQFESAVNAIKGVADGALQGVKSVWETTWAAIQKAAESPAQAMNVLIGLVDKLKSIMPEWLIPHSPTPFQVGLEGIMKAAKGMDGAFGDMSGVDNWLKAALSYTKMPADWLEPLKWIIGHESGGDPHAKNPHSTASGLFQMIDTTWADARDKSLPNDIWNPIINAIAGIRYIADRYGNANNAVDFWKAHGHYAQGGWAGLHGPELAMLGERGPEYVVPNAALRGGGGGLGQMQRLQIDVTADGRTKERLWIEGYQLLARRGGLPGKFGDFA